MEIKNKELLDFFNSIDIDQEIPVKVYRTTFEDGKKQYFEGGSNNLLLQYLVDFKKRTRFLSNARKIKIIEQYPEPKFSKSESPEFDQTIFEGKFLFYEFLQDYKTELSQPQPGKPKLTIKQIALKLYYERNQVTRENHNEIVKKYGWKSGEALFQSFTYYSQTQNRKGAETTRKKFINKIELFESVIKLLPEPNKQRAVDELNMLKALFENEFL